MSRWVTASPSGRGAHDEARDIGWLGRWWGRVSQPFEDGGDRGVGDRAGIEFHRGQRWCAQHAHGAGVDADHGEVAWTLQPRLVNAVQDDAGYLVALGAHCRHAVA